MTENKLFLTRSKNPLEELRVVNILDTASTSTVAVALHFWNRNPSDLVQAKNQDLGADVLHLLERQGGYNKGIASLFGQIRWQFFMLAHIFKEKPKMIYACDLDSAIIPLFYKVVHIFDKPILIFDEFDSFATRNDKFGRFAKSVFFALERLVCAGADHVVVASNERKKEVSDIVIQNLPNSVKTRKFTEKSLSPKISYVGLLQSDRGLHALSKAAEIKSNWRFTIGGFGELLDGLLHLAPTNVSFLGELSYDATLEEFSESWLTVATYDPKFGNNRLAASTKVLQSLSVHTPVVVSKGGVLADVVVGNGLGWAIEHNNFVELSDVLTRREMWSATESDTFVKNADKFIADLERQQALNKNYLTQILRSGR
jgi:glycosyltransferase involved in cell wall biosynthesis